MSAETPAQTENPEWKKHWIRYARFNDQHLVLVDHQLRDHEQQRTHPALGHYAVGIGPAECLSLDDCPEPSAIHFEKIWFGDSLEDANEVFDLRESELLKR